MRKLAAGGAQPNLNCKKVKDLRVPLPPLAEQMRIVSKVADLMAICDKLEEALKVKNERAVAFAQSVIAHELAADPAKVRELAGV